MKHIINVQNNTLQQINSIVSQLFWEFGYTLKQTSSRSWVSVERHSTFPGVTSPKFIICRTTKQELHYYQT